MKLTQDTNFANLNPNKKVNLAQIQHKPKTKEETRNKRRMRDSVGEITKTSTNRKNPPKRTKV